MKEMLYYPKYVIKRTGEQVPFDEHKIESAISKAYSNAEIDITEDVKKELTKLTAHICHKLYLVYNDMVGIEQIQDVVEDCLMAWRKDVAKNYIRYRYEHGMIRDKYNEFMANVAKKIMASNVENQNANVDEKSFGGRKGEAANILMKQFALDYCMSDMARENHLNNIIYEHDLDSYPLGMHNCLTIPFDDIFENGFNTRQTDVRPPQSASTGGQLIAVVSQIQSLQQFGGVAASHIDHSMVPLVRKSFTKHFQDGLVWCEHGTIKSFKNDSEHPDGTIHFDDKTFRSQHPLAWDYAMEMTRKEVYQTIEGLYHNLNTLQSRSGNQLPFTSINYGTCILEEGRLVTRAILDMSIDGLGKLNRTSIFPCGIFQCMKGVNRAPDDPNYDLFQLALKSTAKRLYPNYANCDWSGNAGYDRNDPRTYFATMGCRTANGYDINGFGQLKDGRGNIAPVTIILPTIAMMAKEAKPAKCVEAFMDILDTKLYEAKDMLIERFDYICSQKPESASFMYENGLMKGYIPEEGIRSALKHGTLAVGQIGLAECLQILIGCDHTEDRGMELAKRIEQLFKDRCSEFKEQYKLNFGVYYSPAENLCFTAMKKFRDKYGIIENVSDKKFFTNSMHVPVWKQMPAFRKIEIESQLTGYSSAGCITYVELTSSVQHNLKALEKLVNYAMDCDIPYFAVNVPNDMCMSCGFTDDINDECPKCGGKTIRRLRRVTGYLTGDYTEAFNEGKQQETEMREKHALKNDFNYIE